MLRLALINVLVLIPVLAIGNLLGGRTPLPVIVVNSLVFALCLVLYSWMHRGRIRQASIGLIALGIVGITVGIASLGTIRVPTTAMYLLMVITAGLLFDLSGMIIVTALCSLLVAGLIVAGNMGLLPPPNYSLTITQWIAYTAIFGWAGSLTYSALKSMNHALARAEKELAERKMAEADLAKHRDHLEELIKERTAELEEKNSLLIDEIAERKKVEGDLRRSRAKYHNIFENSILGLYQSIPSGRYLSVNPAFALLFGYDSPEEMLESVDDIGQQLYANNNDRERAIKLITEQGYLEGFELEVRRRDGTRFWVSMNTLIVQDEDGTHFDGTVEDITERKQAEDNLKASLQEKEILLKEVHHRVKNNLQIVHSLLNIQANNIQDDNAREAISECRNRVRSIALVHEKLYRSENLAKVDFAGYISGLTRSLLVSFGVGRRHIRLDLNLDPVLLSIDKAIPCGLIVNELVSNCLKHAFPGERAGVIQVELRSLDKDHVSLVVRDDGIGLAEALEPQKTKTLGLRLVTDLVKQLKGEIQIDHRGGTEFKILFPAV